MGTSSKGPHRKEQYVRLRFEVLHQYGGCCSCCGETIPEFLCFDHIEGNGTKERRSGLAGETFLRRLKKEHRDDIRILCWNCNEGRELNKGDCPHHGRHSRSIRTQLLLTRHGGQVVIGGRAIEPLLPGTVPGPGLTVTDESEQMTPGRPKPERHV